MTDRPKKKRDGTLCEDVGCCRFVLCVFTLSYQFPRQEDVLLPCHHHRHTLSLPGAAQHGHEFLLATACHVYSVHLHTHTRNERGNTHIGVDYKAYRWYCVLRHILTLTLREKNTFFKHTITDRLIFFLTIYNNHH